MTPVNPLDALIASYVEAIESGRAPDRGDLLARHPDHAEALRTFFADYDRMDRVAATLRIGGGVEETAALDGLGTPRPSSVRYFGDYELIEEIARGGMGVVYKARQVSLNRVVALKMILAGTFATPRDVARFQAEAEAAANLDHPHIVPVHEVGEHEGQQYFSMKFIEGGSLSKHPRGEIKAEVLGLITIARAVHHAHQHGVLHRDLKPSNVLVDARGGRHVTDFGLAKRLTDLDRSLTEAGQILGTPRYMSPEQAAGRKDLTVAADVYALGVILYERLTGRTPFDGESALALLRQVREAEPPRPSTIRPGLDRDLETIVLKCLDKDLTRRYPTADELVDDLTRWHEGRPIAARPVGQAERFARWCRRNPAIAGLAASVALALTLGTAVSSLFAVQERTARLGEQEARIRAEAAEDRTERALARSLGRPLFLDDLARSVARPVFADALGRWGAGDFQMFELVRPGLSEPEVEALWELAGSGTESLRGRFLEEATRVPLLLRQVSTRSEPALIAALGLDPDRRERTAGKLAGRLRDGALAFEDRFNLALLLLQIEDKPEPWAEEASKVIDQALDNIPPPRLRTVPALRFFGSWDSFTPSRSATLQLAWLERSTKDASITGACSDSLPKVLGRLGPSEALAFRGPVARAIASSIGRDQDGWDRVHLIPVLAGLAGWLDPAGAATIARAVITSIEGETKAEIRALVEPALVALSARLDPADAASLARAVARSLEREKIAFVRSNLAWALVALSRRLDRAEAAATCGRAARAMASAFDREKDAEARSALGQALEPLAGWLDPAEAAPLARAIADSIDREGVTGVRVASAFGLVALWGRLDRVEASALCGRAACAILSRFDPEEDITVHSRLGEAVLGLSGALDPAGAATVVRALILAIGRGADSKTFLGIDVDDWGVLSYALRSLAGRLDPADVAAISRAMLESIERDKRENLRSSMAFDLDSFAGRVEAAEAEPVARSIAGAIEREAEPEVRLYLTRALVSLSGKVRPDVASALCGPAARSIAKLLEGRGTAGETAGEAGLLPPLLGRLDRAEAETTGRFIAQATGCAEGDYGRKVLASALVSLTGKFDAAERAALCGPAARSIAEALEQHNGNSDPNQLAEVLATLTGQLALTDGADLCGRVARSINRGIVGARAGESRQQLGQALATLSVRLDPAEVGMIARSIVPAFASEKTSQARADLAVVLGSLAGRLDPAEAGAIARPIAEALGREGDPALMAQLATAVIALAGRLEWSEGAELHALAARSIAGAIGRGGGDLANLPLLQALVALSGRFESLAMIREMADRLCSRPMQDGMAGPLRALLTSPARSTRDERAARFLMTVLQGGTMAATIREAPEPYPCRLTSQELVELLKMPTCLGSARRVVLDQLGTLHGRRFFNHWDFVRFAREEGLKLDFTSPPRRPDPDASSGRSIEGSRSGR